MYLEAAVDKTTSNLLHSDRSSGVLSETSHIYQARCPVPRIRQTLATFWTVTLLIDVGLEESLLHFFGHSLSSIENISDSLR